MNKEYQFRPEILAPAGDAERAYIAAESGADAVYFGLQNFSARKATANIKLSELEKLVKDLHQQDVKSYVTLNTILYDEEIEKAASYFDLCQAAKVDGIIIQDLYWLTLFSNLKPDIELHASTQMNIHSDLDLKAAAELGFKRVVLPRETSSNQLTLWMKQAKKLNLETELFVHGAVCMSVSGRCQMSFAQGGRSANRGACAQACRLFYDLKNSEDKIIDQGALLSAKDQSLISKIPLLSKLKVDSLKIEGRMKNAEYVRATTSIFRKSVDFWFKCQDENVFSDFAREQELLLLQVFNRGGSFSNRSFNLGGGKEHTTGNFVGNYGSYLGKIKSIDLKEGEIYFTSENNNKLMDQIENKKLIDLLTKLKAKDQISIRRKNLKIASAPIGVVIQNSKEVMIKGFHPDKMKQMRIGDDVFLLRKAGLDVAFESGLTKKFDLNFHLKVGQKGLKIEALTNLNKGKIVVEDQYIFSGSELVDRSLAEDRWIKQLSKTGASNFEIEDVFFSYDETNVLPPIRVSAINSIRRKIIELMQEKIAETLESSGVNFKPNLKLNGSISQMKSSDLIDNQEIKRPKTLLSIISPESLINISKVNLKEIDQLEINLLFLHNFSELSKMFNNIWKHNSNIEMLIRLPEIMQKKQVLLFEDLRNKFRGQTKVNFSCNGLAVLNGDSYNTKLTHINEQANIINSQALKLLLTHTKAGISVSPEWNDHSFEQFLNSLSDADCARIYLPYNYLTPEMYLNYCPVGKNAKNCKLCLTNQDTLWSQTYQLITKQAPFTKHHLIPYPHSCHSQIYAHQPDNELWRQLSKHNRNRVSIRITDSIIE